MQRLPRMDGLRGVLAVYVMLGHAMPFAILPDWITAPFRHGEAAVDLFFALSGLVIANSLERFGGKFRPFMAARARRLLPVYFVALGLNVVLLMFGNPLAAMPWVGPVGGLFWAAVLPPGFSWHLAAHLLLLHGVIPQGLLPYAYVTLLGPAWSLSTEWQFYVVMGLIAPRRLGWFALVMLAVGVAYHFLHLPPWWQFSRAFLPDAAPYFALGLGSAVWLRGGGRTLFVVCLLGACAAGLTGGIGKALVPLAWAAVMLAQEPRWGAVLESSGLQYLGAISYPLYLLNEPVQRGLAMLLAPLAHGNAMVFTVSWLPLAVTMPVVAAVLLHHGVELRFMRANNRILRPGIARSVQP
jgi:peptidoglycan/LPS O-acetylase OafA/YrhL